MRVFALCLLLLALIPLAAAAPAPQSNLDDDVFELTCDSGEQIIGGIKFTFLNVNAGFRYRVSVIGINGFDPVMAVVTAPGIGACNDDFSRLAGSQVAVPGIGLVTADERAAQIEISTGRGGNIDVVVGGYAGSYGQFAMVVEGLQVNPADDVDGFLLAVPEVVMNNEVGVYMISRDGSPLDPYLYAWYGTGLQQNPLNFDAVELFAECDDVATNECPGTPAFPGGGVMITNGYRYEAGNRDAGLVIIPQTTDRLLLGFGSYDYGSTGDYGIIVVGTAPGTLDAVALEPDGGIDPADQECTPVPATIKFASSEFDASYSADRLLDGNVATGWSSALGDTAPYITFSFGRERTINAVMFYSYSSSPGYENDSINEFMLTTPDASGEPVIALEGSARMLPGYAFYPVNPVTTDEMTLVMHSTHGGAYFEASEIRFCGS